MTEQDMAWRHSHLRCAFHLEHFTRRHSIYEEMHLTALRICRQIHNEADRVLWSTNTFSFADAATFGRFMDTRTTCQKRFLKNLRLQMNRIPNQEADWSRVLSMKLIRSLVGLRSLRLQINHTMDPKRYQSIGALWDDFDWCNVIQMRLRFLRRMKVLPLTEVEVFVGDYGMTLPSIRQVIWVAKDRTEYADAIRRILLDPEGAESYAQDRKELKEFHRQEREGTRESQASRAATQQKLIELDAVWNHHSIRFDFDFD